MKTLKDVKAINASSTMTPVSLDVLREKGQSNNGFRFATGDQVAIPEDLEIFAESFRTQSGENMFYYLVKADVNGQPFMVSVASFRRDRTGIEDFVEQYHKQSPVARILSGLANDEERMRYLAGKNLKVTGLMQAREYQFDNGNRIAYSSEDPKTYRTRFWPIFEEV